MYIGTLPLRRDCNNLCTYHSICGKIRSVDNIVFTPYLYIFNPPRFDAKCIQMHNEQSIVKRIKLARRVINCSLPVYAHNIRTKEQFIH